MTPSRIFFPIPQIYEKPSPFFPLIPSKFKFECTINVRNPTNPFFNSSSNTIFHVDDMSPSNNLGDFDKLRLLLSMTRKGFG